MRNEELWYRLSAINFLIGANAVRLLLVYQTCVIPHIWLQVLLPQNRFALCGFYFVQEDRKAVQILFLRYTFIIKHYFYMLFCFTLHRLVGLRRMRLCLILRQGFALYPQGVSPLDPDQGRVPGPFARFARC